MKERAILVDWSLYSANTHVQEFIKAREGQARMVLLVTEPKTNDYMYPTDYTATDDYPTLGRDSIDGIEWDAVIRNTGDLADVKFKENAVTILKEVSNLDPVIGLDKSSAVNTVYRAQGVLVTTEDF